MAEIPLEGITPCGIICFACRAYLKGTCHGCRSEAPQKRKSKFLCKIRVCCLDTKHYQLCNQCSEAPCKAFHQKLLKTHTDEAKYAYRRDTLVHFRLIKRVGLQKALEFLNRRWTCPACGGRILFYEYTCFKCGRSYFNEIQDFHEAEIQDDNGGKVLKS